MANYYDFKNSHLGGFYDKDGWYSAQCWDGYAEYCTWLGVPYANCTDTGYASDIDATWRRSSVSCNRFHTADTHCDF